MVEDPKIRSIQAIAHKPSELPAQTLTFDWDLYGEYLENSDLSDAEKRDTIEALWSIVVSFVDLGFGVHSAQLATKDCCEQNGSLITAKPASMVNCSHTSQKEFTVSAHGNAALTPDRSPE